MQRGTGDAVMVGMTAFHDDDVDDDGTVVVLPGDTPLLRPDTVSALVAEHEAQDNAATVLSAHMAEPTGYGRVDPRARRPGGPHRRGAGRVLRGARRRRGEHRASTASAATCSAPALRRLSPDNAQGEYYLTDVIGVLASAGYSVGATAVTDPAETQGVNDRAQLADAEAELRARTNRHWLLNGVTMLDPVQTFIDVTVDLGRDVTLYPGTILQGRTTIGAGCEIGPDTRLVDCVGRRRSGDRAHRRPPERDRRGRPRGAVRQPPARLPDRCRGGDRGLLHWPSGVGLAGRRGA